MFMKRNTIDVLYATNSHYLLYTLASMLSFIEHSGLGQDKINIHLMTEGCSGDDYRFAQEVLSDFSHVFLSIYPIEEYSMSKYHIPPWQNTQVANARLFFQDILGSKIADIDSLLYLDSDTMVVGSLEELLDKKDGLYAVRDNCQPSYYRRFGLDKYFNSGVLWIDTKSWIENHYQDKIVTFIKNNRDIKLKYPDQDILNCSLKDDIKELTHSYNLSPYIAMSSDFGLRYSCRREGIDYKEVQEERIHPKIIHSCGILGIKPWTQNQVNPYNDIFRDYIKRVDCSFEVESLDSIMSFLSENPRLFSMFLNLKTFTPDCVHQATVSLLSKIKSK